MVSYHIKTPIVINEQHAIHFYNDSSFTYSYPFDHVDSRSLRNLNLLLPKLKKGTKYTVGSINFIGGSPDFLYQSVQSINNLYRLMKKNRGLKIEIIGYVNGCGAPNGQKLSEQRAEKNHGGVG